MTNVISDSIHIAEDDTLRSQHMHGLFQEIVPISSSQVSSSIPKIIIQFWHNLDKIPTDVQACLNSWMPLEKQGFKRELFDEPTARRFISEKYSNDYVKAFDRCHHPAMKCDYFRLCYLLINGGFYIDADEMYQGIDCTPFFRDNRLKIQPLCYDIDSESMVNPEIFMKQGKQTPNWIYYVNNNPLISPANHPVIRLALDRATKILLRNRKAEVHQIQSTTGPGNLTASLVRHSIACKISGTINDFSILPNWNEISLSPWPLSYRDDKRNWRLWNPERSNGKYEF